MLSFCDDTLEARNLIFEAHTFIVEAEGGGKLQQEAAGGGRKQTVSKTRAGFQNLRGAIVGAALGLRGAAAGAALELRRGAAGFEGSGLWGSGS